MKSFFCVTIITLLNFSQNAGAMGFKILNQIPTQLAAIEGLAEDSYDLALGKSYPQVILNAKTINSNWLGFRKQAIADGASEKLVFEMDKIVADFLKASGSVKDPVVLARSANTVSSKIDTFFDLYKPSVPSSVMKLDYLGRELVLDGMAKDFEHANTQLGEVKIIWAALLPQVTKAKGVSEADAYEKSNQGIAAALSQQNAEQVITEAKMGLDTLDLIEKLFTH